MIVIGVDESGTGAWAGPFTVSAVALRKDQTIEGVTDSKRLTDLARRNLIEAIHRESLAFYVATVPVDDIRRLGMSTCWSLAIWSCIVRVQRKLSLAPNEFRIIVDGPPKKLLNQKLRGLRAKFKAKADLKFPSVGAASILAKTARNDAMIELHRKYGGYGWDRNAGYGVPEHKEGIEALGITKEHRPVRPLRKKLEEAGLWKGTG